MKDSLTNKDIEILSSEDSADHSYMSSPLLNTAVG